MMKSHDEIVAALKATGMTVDQFTLESEGAFTEADADWNYKDVPHLFHVHPGVRPVLGIIEHDQFVWINMQRVFGLRAPIIVASYHAADHPETYFTTWFAFALVVSARYAQRDARTCRVEVSYSVAAPKLLAWSLPMVRWVIKRNYRWLMEADILMRGRRADLRKRGYGFDRPGERYSFLDSMEINRSNVVPPAETAPFDAVTIDVGADLPPGTEILFGDDGHLGLRLIRQGDRILVFPRLCSHEGASLDGRACENERIKCPWHGRVIAPLAMLHATRPEREERTVGAYRLRREDGMLRIEPGAEGPGRGPA